MMAEDHGPADMFRTLWDKGYKRLIPVVPPGAALDERGALARRLKAGQDARGKAPGIRKEDGTWRGMNFVAMEAQEQDLEVWQSWGASTGIKTGHGLIAVDIDTTDRKAAQTLYELAAQMLGPAHVRFGQKPKCLMLYEAPATTPYQSLSFSTDTEDSAKVEILSEGRQFVASGTHPKTGEPYVWPGGIPRRDQITKITTEQLDAFLAEAARKLPGARRSGAAEHDPNADPVDQESLRAPSLEALQAAVEATPNTSLIFPKRDDYVDMAYAIRGSVDADYDDLARDLYLEWCARWEDGDNNPVQALEDWSRAKRPTRYGFPYILQRATGLYFKPVETDPVHEMFAAVDQADKRPRRYLLDLEDIFTLPDPEFLIGRHLPKDGFGLLYGDPGCGKSFVALDMAMHLAYGAPDWHGDPIDQTAKDRTVLYIAGEGAFGLQPRLKAWVAKHATDPWTHGKKPNIRFLIHPVNFMRHGDVEDLTKLIDREDVQDMSLIIVDTVSRSIPGADENLQKDMTIFVQACDALRSHTGAFVLGVHHTAKSGDMRGSSVFLGQADVVLKLQRQKGADTARLTCEKQKDAPDGWHDHYRLETTTTADGKTSLVPQRVEAPGADAVRADTTLQRRIFEAIQAAWDAGVPWSPAAQSRDRYAIRVMARDFEVPGDVAEQWLSIWLTQEKVLEVATRDSKSHVRGLRVVGDLDEIFSLSTAGDEAASDIFD